MLGYTPHVVTKEEVKRRLDIMNKKAALKAFQQVYMKISIFDIDGMSDEEVDRAYNRAFGRNNTHAETEERKG